MHYRVRFVEFVGETEYTQGNGMTWDDVVIDVADDEQIIDCKATWKRGRGFNAELACVQVWLMSPTADDPTPTVAEKQAEEPVVVNPPMHYEVVLDHRGRWEKAKDALRHRHYPIWRQWTQDDSSWTNDPAAIEICSCGARQRLWGGTWA